MSSVKDWTASVIKQAEIDKYLDGGKDFIDEEQIFADIEKHKNPDKQQVRDILQKSLDIKILTPAETATLLNVEEPELLHEMQEAAVEVKKAAGRAGDEERLVVPERRDSPQPTATTTSGLLEYWPLAATIVVLVVVILVQLLIG